MSTQNQADSGTKPPEAPQEINKQGPPPWRPIFAAHDAFLNDLECITEMFLLVAPVIKSKDEERKKRISELSEEIETERGKARRLKSAQDLKEFMGHIKKRERAEHMFRHNIITSIVSKFDEFLMRILKVSFEHNSGWLKNPDKKITYKELLEIQSLDQLKSDLVIREVDLLMRDSHKCQITFLDSRLKLGIEKEFSKWKDFLEITERRNLFVHTGGTVSHQYLENCAEYGISVNPKCKEGTRISASDNYIANAADVFCELCVRVTQATVRRLFPDCFKEADSLLNNRSVELMTQDRWKLTERMFEYALGIPEDLRSKEEMEFYFLINLCIALKFGGKDFKKRLHSVSWTPFHPKYQFAVAVLEDRFDEAEVLMRSEAVLKEIKEENFRDWPLLRDFRKTQQFKKAFQDIYKKDIDVALVEEVKKGIEEQKLTSAECSKTENVKSDSSSPSTAPENK